MAVLIERCVVMFLMTFFARNVLVMEQIVVLFTGVLLQEVQDHLRHTHPLMQFHGAEAIDREGECEKEAAHLVANLCLGTRDPERGYKERGLNR